MIREIDRTAFKPYVAGRAVEMARVPTEHFMANDLREERLSDATDFRGDRSYNNDAMSTGFSVIRAEADSREATVAAVSVEWSPEPSTENLSYQFTEEDDATGTVTTGSVERSGNSIEIRMESTPAAETPLRRGELSDEDNPAA
jgi:hypothetical protein